MPHLPRLHLSINLNNVLLFKKILLLLLVATLFSCKKKEENELKTTYIGGQIINPIVDYIIFFEGNDVLDTIKLDANNFFHFSTDKITAGLYTLRHNENQVFFIEPGDSLLVHINTIDFDESLAYSGKGGEQNNLLMDLYLKNEAENQNLPKWYGLSSKDFEHKIDSFKQIKEAEYKNFIETNDVSDEFKNVALSSIAYDSYSKKEMYAAANRSIPEKFDNQFFDYRKEINFGMDELKFYYPYYRFMNRYFENMACSKFDKKNPIDRNSFEYNYRKLKLIDSVVTSDSIKNTLLRNNAMYYFVNAKNSEEEQKFFEMYSKMNTDKKNLEEVSKVFNASVKLNAGNSMPNILLVNTDNVVKDLQSLINQPTVLFFWSSQSSTQIHNRVAELKSKYPEYKFFGINTDTHFKKWRETVNKAGYNSTTEFQLESRADAEKKLILNSLNTVFIVDKNAIILEGKTNMFNTNFEELLLGFLNR